MFDLAWPWIFLLLPLPWLAARLLPPAIPPQPLKLPPGLNLPGLTSTQPNTLARPNILALFIWLLLLCALAGPRWLGDPHNNPAAGRDLMLALDLSGSMGQRDLEGRRGPNRLQVVQHLMGPFIDRRSGDRLGLILFGSNAYLQAPLTYDRQSVRQYLEEAMINLAGKRTAIGDAIGLAVKQLELRPKPSRALLLLTDGDNTAGALSPLQATALAEQAGIRIYTIGIGGAPQRRGPWQVNPASDLDETTLKQIAERTGGRYFRAHDQQSLEEIYQVLDQLEPSEDQGAYLRPERALYHWPLALALLLSFIWASWRLLPRFTAPLLGGGKHSG